jgi:hypothetical protein
MGTLGTASFFGLSGDGSMRERRHFGLFWGRRVLNQKWSPTFTERRVESYVRWREWRLSISRSVRVFSDDMPALKTGDWTQHI